MPKIIPKGTTRLPEIERTILALYGGGMSTRDIAAELERAYGIDASPTFISYANPSKPEPSFPMTKPFSN